MSLKISQFHIDKYCLVDHHRRTVDTENLAVFSKQKCGNTGIGMRSTTFINKAG